ncbi:MAG: tetratricopeptide repeat protein, partial [Thermodesulfobacteriota bacterium]
MRYKATLIALLVLTILVAPGLSLPGHARNTVIDDPEFQSALEDYREENYEEAVFALELVRANHPRSAIAAYYLGLAYKQMMDYEMAARNLKEATTLKPGVKDAFFDLAEMYYQLGEDDNSLREIENAIRLGVKPAAAEFLKGLVLTRKNKPAVAIESFKKAKKEDPAMTQSADYRTGLALIKQGKLKDAEKMLNEVIIKDPNSDLATFAKQHVEQIEQKAEELRPLKLFASVGYEYDDNAFLKPADTSAPGGTITGEHDSRLVFSFRGEVVPQIQGPFGLKAQYSLYHSEHNKLDTLDVSSHTFAVVPSYRVYRGTASVLTSYNHTWVADNEYMSAVTLSPGYTFIIVPGFMGQAGARVQYKDY